MKIWVTDTHTLTHTHTHTHTSKTQGSEQIFSVTGHISSFHGSELYHLCGSSQFLTQLLVASVPYLQNIGNNSISLGKL